MNCCASEELDQRALRQNKDIDSHLEDDKKKAKNIFRLLLLGAGESGKSTIAKQMKIIHLDGFTKEEKDMFITAIHTNIFMSVKAMVTFAREQKLKVRVPEKILTKFDAGFGNQLTAAMGKEIRQIWGDTGIQTAYERRGEYQLNDSTQYYLDEIERVTAADYVPTDQDVLRSRVQTTGIIETEFEVESFKFVMVDVGGQRSERKKWMHCFEDITAVIYCVGISAFDQTLYEDNVTNRLQESLKLFHEICQSKWFTYTAIILFLNKSDLFLVKLAEGKSIRSAFPEYTGPDTFEASAKYIEQKFTAVKDPVTGKPKDIFTHVTCATDTSNVRRVFSSVKNFITNISLAHANLI